MSRVYLQPLIHQSFSEFVSFAKQENYNLEIATFAYYNTFETDWQGILQEHLQQMTDFKGKISFHGVFQDVLIHSSDKRIASVSKERIITSLDAAKALKATDVIFHGNFNPLVTGEYYKKNWVERNSEFWSEILEKYNFTILLENTWEPTPDPFRKILDQVNSSRFKICFDIGHSNVYSKLTFKEWMTAIGHEIPYMHLSDNSGEKDQHQEIGNGKINWQEFTSTVKEYGTDPAIVLELTTLEKTKQSINYMEEQGIYPFLAH